MEPPVSDPFDIFNDDLDAPRKPSIIREAGRPVYAQTPARPAPETFPCQSCAGTGRWVRGVNQNGDDRCFACGGKGSFKTSYKDRQVKREKAATRKASRLDDAKSDFELAHPGLIARVREAASWMDFARSLLEGYDKYGSLTDGQVAAITRSLDKADATRAAKIAATAERKASSSGAIDASVIEGLFAKASGSGLKRPVFRTAAFDLSLAPAAGRNPGAIYVKKGDTYLGKIAGGQYFASREAGPETHAALIEVVKDPLGVAVSYGRLTGRCSCCGLGLTNKLSVELGIGPICRKKWGI